MNDYHSQIAFNNALQFNPSSWHIGNATSPLDFATTISGPYGTGAGSVPPAGVYATQLDVSTSTGREDSTKKSIVPEVLLVAVAIILMYTRR